MRSNFAHQARCARALLVAASISGLLAGCGGNGEHTTSEKSAAVSRMNGLKSGINFQMAQDQFMCGELDKALKSVDASISLKEDVARSHVLRGRIMIEKGELEEAKAALLRAETIDPTMVEAQYYMGIVYERFSQPEQALARYERAIALDRTNAQYFVAAAEMMVQLKRIDEADALLADPGEVLSRNAPIMHCRGRIAMIKGDNAKAAQYMGEARLLAPDDLSIIEDLARAQLDAGLYADAEYNLGVLLSNKANKDRRDLLSMRAECYVALDRLVEARSILISLTSDQAGSKDLPTWIALGKTCVALGDLNRLRLVAARVIALAPNRYDGYLLKAMYLRSAGDKQGALAMLDQAIAHEPSAPSPYLMRGLLLVDLRQFDSAKVALTAAVERNPKNEEAKRMLAAIESGDLQR